MNYENKIIVLSTDCQLVKGYTKSAIYDLNRRNCHPIPNSLYLLLNNSNKTIKQIKKSVSNENQDIIDEYYSYLSENDLLLEVNKDEISFFPKLNLKWENPQTITNCVTKGNDILKLKDAINQLKSLLTDNIQIHIEDTSNIRDIIEVIHSYSDLIFELFIKFSKSLDLCDFQKANNISMLYIHSAPEDKCVSVDNIIITHIIKQQLDFKKTCGNVNPYYFTINFPLFLESQAHNTCLNRKLCIDAEGNIKNCPAMERSFGNIKDTTLQEAIEKPGFKDMWFIHKDQIDVCKDCEFRHMCTDCRCFIKDPGNIYSQPAKCTYNPYICKWKGEEGYVPVEECGSYNRETGFVPNHEKIERLNKQIWGEDDE